MSSPLASLTLLQILALFIGGGLGSLARYLGASAVNSLHNSHFPLGTWAVNIVGSFCIGWWMTHLIDWNNPLRESVRLFAIVGFLGGFTTFSSFSLETVKLMQDDKFLVAGTYVLISVLAGIFATLLGIWVAKNFN